VAETAITAAKQAAAAVAVLIGNDRLCMDVSGYFGMSRESSSQRVQIVEILWNDGAILVEPRTPENIFGEIAPELAPPGSRRAPSYVLSLDRARRMRRMRLLRAHPEQLIVVCHRFEKIIGGRQYLIEVASVAERRWRAQIVRIPGIPSAMMPFYGETPDEAAEQLSEWLHRAYRQQANTV
jgi:hypothetical protein